MRQNAKMSVNATIQSTLADDIISELRRHRKELRTAGIRELSLFGSVARDEAGSTSDIDLAAVLDETAELSLLDLAALERQLGGILGRPVSLLPEPAENARLQARIDRDRRRAF